MTVTIFGNARIFDGWSADCLEGGWVCVEGDEIKEVSERPIELAGARKIDLSGKTLLPGLIDAHIHAYFCDMNWQKTDEAGEAYRAAHASRMLRHALECGFTTVRDVGGGDHGLACAIKDGLIQSPRFFYAGKMLSMTGGHGDTRLMSQQDHSQGYCSCGSANALNVVVDGVDACIKAAREELRRGAHCLKIMASGGVASPTDPIWMNQFRDDEIRAIVGEATERRTYVSAHCHTSRAIARCVELGVRVIEHGTMIDEQTAQLVAANGVYIVPTIVIIHALVELGARYNIVPDSIEKARVILRHATDGLDTMRRAGVMIGFGTDLLGESYNQQCREFTIRREVFTPVEILRQATSTNARVLMHEDRLGCIKAGAFADIIVTDGDPLEDISLLAANGENLALIMAAGRLVKNRIN